MHKDSVWQDAPNQNKQKDGSFPRSPDATVLFAETQINYDQLWALVFELGMGIAWHT